MSTVTNGKEYSSWTQVHDAVGKLYRKLTIPASMAVPDGERIHDITGVVPVPRGGLIPGSMLAYLLKVPVKQLPDEEHDVIFDEIVDSGKTLKVYKHTHPKNKFVSLFVNSINLPKHLYPSAYVYETTNWQVFPWEEQ